MGRWSASVWRSAKDEKQFRPGYADWGKRLESAGPGPLLKQVIVRYPASQPPPAPPWMKVRLPLATPEPSAGGQVKAAVRESGLVTVCQEASCPNLGHCWSRGTATFMIMGSRCTRRCGFCDVDTARPFDLDLTEPARLSETIRRMGLSHVVVTSVDRDDLSDCGSAHFAAAIRAIRSRNPSTSIEVLIPDFKGRRENLERIWDAKPHVINHNVETVPSLFATICPQSRYETSLHVLRESTGQGFLTKSGLILGLGEAPDEVRSVLGDLRAAGVSMVTIGQYLQPSPDHAPLREYIEPRVFEELGDYARGLGFRHVESGPLVRSSYHADESYRALLREAGLLSNP